jgi:hypothetical protein
MCPGADLNPRSLKLWNSPHVTLAKLHFNMSS